MKKFIIQCAVLCLLTFPIVALAKKNETIINIEDNLTLCKMNFNNMEKLCPDSWSMKCYNHLMKTNKITQQCYKNIAVKLFEKFYNLSSDKAKNKFDEYYHFMYKQHLFIYADTAYCKQNNCGLSLYLYSEYATTEELYNYIDKIIKSVSARD